MNIFKKMYFYALYAPYRLIEILGISKLGKIGKGGKSIGSRSTSNNFPYFSIFVIILGLCLLNYYIMKKERYYNKINGNISNNNNINGNKNFFIPTDLQKEEKRKHGCTGVEFDKKMDNFHKMLDSYQETYQKKQNTLHKYEDLTDDLEDIKKKLIKTEEGVKQCIPNFTD